MCRFVMKEGILKCLFHMLLDRTSQQMTEADKHGKMLDTPTVFPPLFLRITIMFLLYHKAQ